MKEAVRERERQRQRQRDRQRQRQHASMEIVTKIADKLHTI